MYLFCWRIFPVGGDVVIFDHPPGVGVETAAAARRAARPFRRVGRSRSAAVR